jgi:exo-1,4-beta-D-glucosaminidase
VWNLYDYFLVPSAAYSSAKKACGAPLHAALTLDDFSVWVTNARNAGAGVGFAVRAEAFALSGAALFNATLPLPGAGVPANGAVRVGGAFSRDAARAALGAGRVWLARLTLLDAGGAAASTPNVYHLSTDADALDWARSTWYDTPVSAFGALTELRTLPPVGAALRAAATALSANATRVDLALDARAPAVAFFARVRLLDARGADVAPARYSDNYVTLRPGEAAAVVVEYDGGAAGPTTVEVRAFNDVAGRGA